MIYDKLSLECHLGLVLELTGICSRFLKQV